MIKINLKNTIMKKYLLYLLTVLVVLTSCEKEDDLLTLPEEHWPDSWSADGGSQDARRLGDGWLKSNKSLALLVPSVFTKHEKNCLINPNHPDLQKRLKSVEIWPYSFDKRLI